MCERTERLFPVYSLCGANRFWKSTVERQGQTWKWLTDGELLVNQTNIACNTLAFKSAALWPLPENDGIGIHRQVVRRRMAREFRLEPGRDVNGKCQWRSPCIDWGTS